MKSIFLTSGPKFSVENEKGIKKAIKLNDFNLVESLKRAIEKYDNLLFICSSPDDYKKSEEFVNIISKSLSLSGLKFKMIDLIDSRNWLFSKSLINSADLIVLLGGNPLEQIDFFSNIELKEKLKKYNGCIMGISAGTINMANSVYSSKDDDIEESMYYKGLGIVDISIEPHFDINDSKRVEEVLLVDSKKKSFIALPDDSFIFIKEKEITLYGEAYYFSNEKYVKIDRKECEKIFKGEF